jgi:hypothetical protein
MSTVTAPLDSLLHDRLAGAAPTLTPGRCVVTIATPALVEIEQLCARFGLRTDRLGEGPRWTSVRVSGPRHIVAALENLARTCRGVPILTPWA